MKIWTVLYKLNDQDFIHAAASTYSTQLKAVDAIRATTLYKGLSVDEQLDADHELQYDGVAEIGDATFMILETELDV